MSTTQPFDAYAPPQADLDGLVAPDDRILARRLGKDLVISKGARLPHICFKCRTEQRLEGRREQFIWVTPWIWFGIAGGWIILLILYFALRKKARLDLPLCKRCAARWQAATLARAFALIWILAAPVLAGLITDAPSVLIWILLLSAPVLPILTLALVVRPRTIRSIRINDDTLTLRGVSDGAIDACLALTVARPLS